MAVIDLDRVSEVRKFSLAELREKVPPILAMYGAEASRTEQVVSAIYHFGLGVQLTPETVLYEAPKRRPGESECVPALWVKTRAAGV